MISVIIPLYNKEKSIVSTIESVLSQTYKDWELIVINDGSTDNSLEVVKSFVDGLQIVDCRLKILSKENGGVCSARNMGIEEAKGEYIALLDADDLWEKEYLTEQMRMVDDYSDAAMWGINFAETNNGKIVRRVPTGLPDGYRGYIYNYFEMPTRISDLFCSSSVLIRKDVFDKVGLFDERIKYAEDSDMWFRIIATNKVAFYDRYMVFYQWDAENRAMTKQRDLRDFLPYIIDKYQEPIYRANQVFYRWVNRWAAVRIKQIYFNDVDQYDAAKTASRKLDYSQLPIKYRFELLTPYWLGKIVYKILH